MNYPWTNRQSSVGSREINVQFRPDDILDSQGQDEIFLGLQMHVITVLKILTDSKSLKFEVAADKVLLLKGFSKEELCLIPGLYISSGWHNMQVLMFLSRV